MTVSRVGVPYTMRQNKPTRERVSEEQSVRCLQMVEHIYRMGSASSQTLTQVTGADSATVQKDLEMLCRGGLKIHVDDQSNYRIQQSIPGFSLRLRAPEVAVAWAKITFCSRCHFNVRDETTFEALSDARVLMATALRKYYPESEGSVCQLPRCSDLDAAESRPETDVSGLDNLRAEAKRVCKRLRIIDLTESGHGCRREQLTTLLGVSDRTIGYDLRIVRNAGIEISFLRDRRSYWVDTLHNHLSKVLSQPGGVSRAAALMIIFGTRDDSRRKAIQGRWCNITSSKIQKSLRLIFRGREQELQAAADAYGSTMCSMA